MMDCYSFALDASTLTWMSCWTCASCFARMRRPQGAFGLLLTLLISSSCFLVASLGIMLCHSRWIARMYRSRNLLRELVLQ